MSPEQKETLDYLTNAQMNYWKALEDEGKRLVSVMLECLRKSVDEAKDRYFKDYDRILYVLEKHHKARPQLENLDLSRLRFIRNVVNREFAKLKTPFMPVLDDVITFDGNISFHFVIDTCKAPNPREIKDLLDPLYPMNSTPSVPHSFVFEREVEREDDISTGTSSE